MQKNASEKCIPKMKKKSTWKMNLMESGILQNGNSIGNDMKKVFYN